MRITSPGNDDTTGSGPTATTRRGTITLIRGCMFSGKTTELLRRLAEHTDSKSLALKHAIDTRFHPTQIVSHAGKAHTAIAVTSAADIVRRVGPEIEFVAIDEAHFFDEHLAAVIAQLADRGLDAVLTSLEPNSWGRPFAVNEALLAVADEILTMTAVCARCGATADRTQRLTPIVHRNMVVAPDNYQPRCRKCWRPPPESPVDG